MHIPDGFVDPATATVTGVLAAAGLAGAVRHAQRHLPPARVPLLGLSAAFVFAAQMLNFPVLGGTSGHLIGGVLTAALLGPSAAVIVISAVLIVQCFLFADGGVTALGANIFNMALVGAASGWAVFELLRRLAPSLTWRVVSAGVAAWASTVLASIACAGELAASGTAAWSAVLGAMAGVHVLIGVGEGLITALVLAAIAKVRPELVGGTALQQRGFDVVMPTGAPSAGAGAVAHAASAGNRESAKSLVLYGLLISAGLALFVAPFASPWPDGLDRTAQTLGFEDKAREPAMPAPIPDYRMPGIPSEGLATAVAGVAGTAAVFALAWMAARALAPRGRVASSGAPR